SCPADCSDSGFYGKFADFYGDIQSYMSFGDYGYASPFSPYSNPHFNFTRSLTASSPPSRVKGVSFYGDSFGNFNGVAGQQVIIKVDSTDFDTYVYLLGPVQRRLIAFNDDVVSGNTNSQLTVTLP